MKSVPSVQLNYDALHKSRVIANIFVGISAGVFGFGLFNGILWWMLMGLATSGLLALRIASLGFEDGESKYFGNVV